MSDARPQFGGYARGATLLGLVRNDNQDCFFVISVARTDGENAVPWADGEPLAAGVERPASLAVVVDARALQDEPMNCRNCGKP